MVARMLKEQTRKANAQVGKYCDVCTSNGNVCPSTWVNCSNHSDKEETEEEEEQEESDLDADLEEARDYHARPPMKKSRQPPKVLHFQSHRPPAGWPAGVRLKFSLKPDLASKIKCAEQEQECEYLEQVQRHVYTEPTPMDDEQESESALKMPLVMVPSKPQKPEPDNAFEPIRGMEELE